MPNQKRDFLDPFSFKSPPFESGVDKIGIR